MNEKRLRIAFAFDMPVDDKQGLSPVSVEAEYEDRATLDWLRETLAAKGDVFDLPWGPDAVSRLAAIDVDVVFNITEAEGGRNRESLVPAVAEAFGIPFTGSGALALGLSLDKYLTKIIARQLGITTPDFLYFRRGEKTVLSPMSFPALVKPNAGGSSMGILVSSKVSSRDELFREVERVKCSCIDDALVEQFIPGREFAVALLERPDLQVLPVAEIRLNGGDPRSFYSFERKSIHKKEIICPAVLPDAIRNTMVDSSKKIFRTLGCRDMARVDFRLGQDGIPYFLEINPLPGLSPYYSVFPVQAGAWGLSPEELVQGLVQRALRRAAAGGVEERSLHGR
jgi:D-alanine-D-alanine ligase